MNERDAQRLAKIDEKMEQMKAQRQDILAKERRRQHRERTHRLIQIGALSEKYFDVKGMVPSDYEAFLKSLLSVDNIVENIATFRKLNE